MTTTIVDAAVFDGQGLLPGRYDVRVVDGTIAAVAPSGTTEPVGLAVDAAGGTLLPGLTDGHVHLLHADDFRALLSGGVTSAADMATWPPERLALLRSQSRGVTFRTSGAPLIGPDGPHSRMPGLTEAVIDSPEAARREVARRVTQGVDYVKLVLEAEGRGGPDRESARAAVQAAHSAGLRVVAHASAVGAIELAVNLGVDILTHAPLDGAVSGATIAQIVQDNLVVIPTLIMMRTTAERRGVPAAYDYCRRFVAELHDAGATLVAGSDANSAPGAPASVPHQTGLHDELALLVDAGLSPVEALRTATATAARLYEWAARGVVRVGAAADLLLVDGDPTTRIRDIDAIRAVWVAGQAVTAR